MFTAKAWRWTSDVFWLSPSPWKQSTHVSISNTPHHVTAIFGSTVCHISKNWCRSIGILYILCGENQSEDICLWRKTYNYAHCSAQDVVSQRPLVVKSYVYTGVSQPPAMQMGDIMWSLRTFGLPFLSSPDAGISEHFDGSTPTTLVRQILSQSSFWILRLNQSQTRLVVGYSWYWHSHASLDFGHFLFSLF